MKYVSQREQMRGMHTSTPALGESLWPRATVWCSRRGPLTAPAEHGVIWVKMESQDWTYLPISVLLAAEHVTGMNRQPNRMSISKQIDTIVYHSLLPPLGQGGLQLSDYLRGLLSTDGWISSKSSKQATLCDVLEELLCSG